MTASDNGQQRTAGQAVADDAVLPFQTVRSHMFGRVVRLSGTLDRILTRHDYPHAVSVALGEALLLTALLGTGLKFEGRLILQTKTDGPLNFLVADFETPGNMRGYASFDAARAQAMEAAAQTDQGRLLGKGHLALTIDPGRDMDRYQGIVALEENTLSEAAMTYFRQSDQLPTFVRLAVARERVADGWRWRAGGLLLQHLAHEGGRSSDELAAAEERGSLLGEEDDHWRRVTLLAATVEDHELVDPSLSPERLLYRLFHEEGVRVDVARPISEYCKCSRERVLDFLHQFGAAELADMREADGTISVTCEFCSTRYAFEPDTIR